jgi:hypothetical protein
VEYYGTPLPIQMPSGLKGIGKIEEGNGSGFQAIGRNAQGPMPIGSPVVGNREKEVGSGSVAIGRTDKLKAKSDEF